MWISTWGPWQDYVTEWWSRAMPKDLYHASCLCIPDTLWRNLPPGYGTEFRERVAWHQCHGLHVVCQLQRKLTMPPRELHSPAHQSTSVPAWNTKLRPRTVKLNHTDTILRDEVRFVHKAHKRRQPGKHNQESLRLHWWASHTLRQRRQTYHTRLWAARYLDHYAPNASLQLHLA